MSAPNPLTITTLKTSYANYLQAQNSNINASAPNTFWDIDAGAMAAFFLDLYMNLQLIQNSIYPQTSTAGQVDQWLYARGLPARGGLTFGTINCLVTTTTPVTIPINTVFTDSNTGNQYQSIQALTVANGSQIVTLYALTAGNNVIEPISNNLTAGAITVSVQSSTNGQLAETDQSCINRILMAIRTPQAGARQTDYYNYALESNITLPSPEVTDAITIEGFYVVGDISTLGDFVLVGTTITEYQLNQGLLPTTSFAGYSRQAGSDVVDNADDYIQSLRLVGLSVQVGTVITYLVTSPSNQLNISVSLVSGYILDTLITIESQNAQNQPISIQLTVQQLIQRELRRAICNQPYGATIINGQNYITIDSLIYALNLQLSYINGSIAQLLTNINISGGDITVPLYSYNTTNLYYTYDIDTYTDIIVTQV